MYGKIFASIFDSTLVANGGPLPTYIFMGMCALADKDGIVDIAPRALYFRLGFPGEKPYPVTFEEFSNAIEFLQAPDPESKSTIFDGCRIVKMCDVTAETLHETLPETALSSNRGYLIVNYISYREKASKLEAKGTSTERVRRWRDRQKKQQLNKNVTGECNACNGDETKKTGHIDIDIDTDIDNNKTLCQAEPDTPPPKNNVKSKNSNSKFLKPSLADVKSYILENHYPVDPQRWMDYYESNGWRVGKNPMKDWKAAIRTWARNSENFGNSKSDDEPNGGYV